MQLHYNDVLTYDNEIMIFEENYGLLINKILGLESMCVASTSNAKHTRAWFAMTVCFSIRLQNGKLI